MGNKHNNKLEKIIDHAIKEMDLSSPSVDFTSQVMGQIEVEEASELLTYRPLISKPVWAMIAVLITSVIGYMLFISEGSSNWMDKIDLSLLTNNTITESLPNFQISTTMTYGLALFGLMFLIQIPLLKHHFNNRLKL